MKIKANKIAVLAGGLGILVLVFACQKNDLPPSSNESLLFFKGKFRGKNIDVVVGQSGMQAVPTIIDDSVHRSRTYNYAISDNLNPVGPQAYINISFNNYTQPYGPLNADIDSTFKAGNKELAFQYAPQTNPLQLNTLTLTLVDSDYTFTSRLYYAPFGSCNIDSSKDMTWKDGITYKMIYMSINTPMLPANTIDSVSSWFLTDAQAALAFPKK